MCSPSSRGSSRPLPSRPTPIEWQPCRVASPSFLLPEGRQKASEIERAIVDANCVTYEQPRSLMGGGPASGAVVLRRAHAGERSRREVTTQRRVAGHPLDRFLDGRVQGPVPHPDLAPLLARARSPWSLAPLGTQPVTSHAAFDPGLLQPSPRSPAPTSISANLPTSGSSLPSCSNATGSPFSSAASSCPSPRREP